MQDLKETLAQELDFVNEGRNGEKCFQDLKCFPYIYVPKIYWDKTSKVRTARELCKLQEIASLLALLRLAYPKLCAVVLSINFNETGITS